MLKEILDNFEQNEINVLYLFVVLPLQLARGFCNSKVNKKDQSPKTTPSEVIRTKLFSRFIIQKEISTTKNLFCKYCIILFL